MEEAIGRALSGLPHGLGVFLMSMIPVTESRGAIAWGMAYWHLPVRVVMLWALLGNTLASLALLLFTEAARRGLGRVPLLGRLSERAFTHAHGHQDRIEKYGPVALVLIGSIPLPGSGPYTLVIISRVFGLPRLQSLAAIEAAMVISDAIVAALTAAGMHLPHLF